MTVPVLTVVLGIAPACGEPLACQGETLSFALASPAELLRIDARLRAGSRDEASAFVEGTYRWMPIDPDAPVAFAVGSNGRGPIFFEGGFGEKLSGRQETLQLSLQRLDHVESATVAGDLAIHGEAVGGCMVSLEVVP